MLSASISKSWSTVRTADGNHQSGMAQPNLGLCPCGARQNAMSVFCSQMIPPYPSMHLSLCTVPQHKGYFSLSSAAAFQTVIPLRHYYFSLSHPKEGTALYFSTLQHKTMSLFFFFF